MVARAVTARPIGRGRFCIGKVPMVTTRTIVILAFAGLLSFAAGFCAQMVMGIMLT